MNQVVCEAMRSSLKMGRSSQLGIRQDLLAGADDVGKCAANIDQNDMGSLRDMWTQVYGLAPPPRVGRDILVLALAWNDQAKNGNGLGRWSREAIERMKSDIKVGEVRIECVAFPKTPTPGTTLIREWNGTTHQVLVLDKGFAYEGRVWRSLSQIAGEITGSRWNGPAFFGLRSKKAGP